MESLKRRHWGFIYLELRSQKRTARGKKCACMTSKGGTSWVGKETPHRIVGRPHRSSCQCFDLLHGKLGGHFVAVGFRLALGEFGCSELGGWRVFREGAAVKDFPWNKKAGEKMLRIWKPQAVIALKKKCWGATNQARKKSKD